jgi:hypothetical protein
MTWFKTPPKTADRRTTRHEAIVSDHMRERLADFLIERGRLLRPKHGHAALHIMGSCKNHDGSKDFSIRTRVRCDDGSQKTFDSHVRWYATDHLRLIR